MTAILPGIGGAPVDLIVFDWDGTVIDPFAAVVSALQSAADDLGLPRPDERQTRNVVGLGLSEALQAVLPSLPAHRRSEFMARYRIHSLARPASEVACAGIPALLKALVGRGRRLAVATGKSRRGLDRALVQTGLASLFVATRCADDGPSKPDPWMLQSLADELGVTAVQMLMVGDSRADIDMARAFGVRSIRVTYAAAGGADPAPCAADFIVDSVPALARLLSDGQAD